MQLLSGTFFLNLRDGSLYSSHRDLLLYYLSHILHITLSLYTREYTLKIYRIYEVVKNMSEEVALIVVCILWAIVIVLAIVICVYPTTEEVEESKSTEPVEVKICS